MSTISAFANIPLLCPHCEHVLSLQASEGNTAYAYRASGYYLTCCNASCAGYNLKYHRPKIELQIFQPKEAS